MPSFAPRYSTIPIMDNYVYSIYYMYFLILYNTGQNLDQGSLLFTPENRQILHSKTFLDIT